MELINKKDLLATINEVYERKYAKCKFKPVQDVYNMIVKRINKAQIINVDAIIHCKECKHWKYVGHDPILSMDFGECRCGQWVSDLGYPETNATDYCSYGNKREENDYDSR